MPAAAVSFWFLAWALFRQRMRPGVYIGGQCLCGLPSDSRERLEKRPREFTLSRTRNTWRGVRAPRAARNVPRAAPRGHWAAARVRFPALRRIRLAFLTSLNVSLRQLTLGPSPRLRQTVSEYLLRIGFFGARGRRGRAASRCMFFTNNTVRKRYEFFGKKP